MKQQYVAYWRDDDQKRMRPIPRPRVAYLLRAARSRGDVIHLMHKTSGYNYEIGMMCINQRFDYHDEFMVEDRNLIE